ncbi:MAG TPA: ATP-binding protein [Thermodesulfovibrionales bacterium]|nr:ATP-binding protein [Thermodesulfovibrionales bacterium]
MEDLSLHILDIAENSIVAGATRVEITVEEDTKKDVLSMKVRDNGRGMDETTLAMVTDPFFTTKTVKRVGLGLPFLKQSSEECEGHFSIASEKGKGTTISVSFRRSHIDRKPLGDMGATVMVLIAGNPFIDFVFHYSKDAYHYRLETEILREELSGVPINSPEILSIIKEDINKGVTEDTRNNANEPASSDPFNYEIRKGGA